MKNLRFIVVLIWPCLFLELEAADQESKNPAAMMDANEFAFLKREADRPLHQLNLETRIQAMSIVGRFVQGTDWRQRAANRSLASLSCSDFLDLSLHGGWHDFFNHEKTVAKVQNAALNTSSLLAQRPNLNLFKLMQTFHCQSAKYSAENPLPRCKLLPAPPPHLPANFYMSDCSQIDPDSQAFMAETGFF